MGGQKVRQVCLTQEVQQILRDIEAGKGADRQRDKDSQTETDKGRRRETDRQTDRQTDRDRHRETQRDRDRGQRQIDRERHRDRQTETDRQREAKTEKDRQKAEVIQFSCARWISCLTPKSHMSLRQNGCNVLSFYIYVMQFTIQKSQKDTYDGGGRYGWERFGRGGGGRFVKCV